VDRAVEQLPKSITLGQVEVALVRWPEEASIRDALAALGRARLLLVDPGAAPPTAFDAGEDWLRWPPDPAELMLRAQHLSQRQRPAELPPVELDRDGMLRRGERWVAVSEAQLPILRLLLDNMGRVVRFESILEAYGSVGGSQHPASVRTVLSRIEARVRPLGLEISSVRRRGVVLRDGARATAR
jgi:hypothetical protein